MLINIFLIIIELSATQMELQEKIFEYQFLVAYSRII